MGKQKQFYYSHKVFEPVTTAIKDTIEKLLEEAQSTTNAVEEPNDSTV